MSAALPAAASSEVELTVAPGCLASLVEAARSAWPEECCGALLGRDGGTGSVAVLTVAEINNQSTADRSRSFAISAESLIELRKRHRASGMDIIGFFHSHPGGSAWPSAHDVAYASPWPGYLQAIVGLRDPGRPVIRFFRAHRRVWSEIPLG